MKTNPRLLLLVTFEWLVIFSFLSNVKDLASSYLGTKNNYSNIKYKDPILCSSPNQNILLTIQPLRNGLWTDNSIWPNGIFPTGNDDVVIPSGRIITMVGTCRAKSLMVNGTLNAVNWQATGAWINLETESIMVNSGGKLEIGTESQPYYANEKCIITLKGNKINNSPDSYKSIMVMGGGTIELHGKKRTSWTNIATTANVGATQITLKEAVNWEIGDKIALTSTALADKGQKSWEHVDEAEIKLISTDKKTLTLKTPLIYKHIGGSKSYTRTRDGKKWNVDIFGEVGLLTHYIKIQGEMGQANETTGFGGHIMTMKGSTAHVEHVELYKMGQKGIKGRYPFHWHLNEDKARDSYLKNSSVHKSFNRAVTIHGTDYVTVDGVFAYDHIGHGIFFEDGGERFNTIKNNVVFVTRRPKPGEQVTPSDNEFDAPQNRTPSSYWITNPNNYFENNVAAGTEGTGFWFAFPANGPMFASRNLPYFSGMVVWKQPLGRFNGFVAHTCMTGWDVFDQLNDDHSLKKNYGWDVATPQLIQKGMFYGNDQAIYSGLGVNGKNENTVFYDCTFSDNKTATMLAGNLTIENSLFNSDSDLGVFTGVREFFRFYDGPGRHVNCHFTGWNRSNAEMIKQVEGGGATENFNPSFIGTTTESSEPVRFRFAAFANPRTTRARTVGQFFKDYDGGLLGKPHTTLIRDIPFLRDGHEYRHSSWVNAARSDYYFASLWLHNIEGIDTSISVVRSKTGTDNACLYDIGQPSSGTFKFPLIVNEGFTYTYYLSQAPSSKRITLFWSRGEVGDLTLVNFKGLGKLAGFSVRGSNLTRLDSKAAVEASTNLSYFIEQNGDVYVKLKAKGEGDRTTVFFNWTGNGTFNATPLPCTNNNFTPGTTITNTPPTVTFMTPTQNQYEEGASLGVVVNALDSDGTISNVKLYVNNVLVRQESGSPYEWGTANPSQNDAALLNLTTGTYILKAIAIDNLGATTTTSKTITVATKTKIVQISKRNAPTYAIDGNFNGADGQNVYLWSSNSSNVNQQWIEIDRGNGYYSYQKVGTNHCIDGNNGGANNQNVYLWTCDDSNQNQQWKKIDMGSGYFRLEKRNAPGFSLDGGSGGANGQNLKLYTSSLNQGMQWSLTTINLPVSNFRMEDEIVVYPNPSESGIFNLDKEYSYKLVDLFGKELVNGKGKIIDISSSPKGIYILYVGSKQIRIIR